MRNLKAQHRYDLDFATQEHKKTLDANHSLESQLAKRHDELQLIKQGLNEQLSDVHSQFEVRHSEQLRQLKEQQRVIGENELEIQLLRAQAKQATERQGAAEQALKRQ